MGCGRCGGVPVGDGAWCGAAWWARRGAARGLSWLASMILGWWGVWCSAARALWGGALGRLAGAGGLSVAPDYPGRAPWQQACCRRDLSWLASGVICGGSCTVRTGFGGLGGPSRVSPVCMHGAAGSGGLGVAGWERATRRCAFESLSLSLALSLSKGSATGLHKRYLSHGPRGYTRLRGTHAPSTAVTYLGPTRPRSRPRCLLDSRPRCPAQLRRPPRRS